MDEKSTPETSTQPSAADRATGSKQNLLISLAVGAVVLLILFMAYSYLQANGAGFSSPSTASSASTAQDNSDLRQRAQAIAARLGTDATALAGMVVELNTRLTNTEEELKGARALYSAAARQVAQLEQLAEQGRLNGAEVELLRGQLTEARSLLEINSRRSEALMAKLSNAPDPTAYSEALALNDSYLAQLRDTRSQLNKMVPRSDFDAVAAKLDQLEPENAKLRAELSATEGQLESVELFVEEIDRLPASAKKLYMELARLETVDKTELQKNYNLIASEIGASVVDTVSFPTGSSVVDPIKAASIRTAIANSSPSSFFLVIGYASKTGNFDLNKSLSSARATATATIADGSKQKGQDVRAVFFGQTDRFSEGNPLADQVCEIWEIKR